MLEQVCAPVAGDEEPRGRRVPLVGEATRARVRPCGGQTRRGAWKPVTGGPSQAGARRVSLGVHALKKKSPGHSWGKVTSALTPDDASWAHRET
eukprot:117277-Amphidinium_carterae.1